jgi:hypothetical protein
MSIPEMVVCPKCNRRLLIAGQLTLLDAVERVYQCDECLEVVEIFGQPFEVALTFTALPLTLAPSPLPPRLQ